MNLNLKKILIKTRKQVFSEIIGNNSSLLKGEGYDFCELKEYEYGDDVKNIDWMISAKKQKPYVKVFHAQKELNINIVNILNGSMHFGTSKLKSTLSIEVASIVAFVAIKQNDPFTSYIANENLNIITKRSKKMHSVQDMLNKYNDYDLIGKNIFYKNISNSLFTSIKKKSIIFIISDFFDSENLDLKLLAKKHEVYALIIRDKFEEEPTSLNNINFKDPGSLKNYNGSLSSNNIKEYIKEVKILDHNLYKHFQVCGIKSTKIYTNEDPYSKLIGLLK